MDTILKYAEPRKREPIKRQAPKNPPNGKARASGSTPRLSANQQGSRMTGGIDKGFCLIYWRMCYRRKFLRTLWIFLLSVAALPLVLLVPCAWTPFGVAY